MERERLGLEIPSLDERLCVEHGDLFKCEMISRSLLCIGAFGSFAGRGMDVNGTDLCAESLMDPGRGERDGDRSFVGESNSKSIVNGPGVELDRFGSIQQ